MNAREAVEWSETDIDEIMGIVERLALDVANGDTSIPQSRLAEILEAVSFCIDEGRLANVGADADEQAALILKGRPSASELHETGYASLVSKATRALSEYNALAPSFDDYGMSEYGDTFREEIPKAFASFDPRFHPAEDVFFAYPLPGIEDRVGIEAVLYAIERIEEEQEALLRLDRMSVCNAAHEASAMGENLYAVVRRMMPKAPQRYS